MSVKTSSSTSIKRDKDKEVDEVDSYEAAREADMQVQLAAEVPTTFMVITPVEREEVTDMTMVASVAEVVMPIEDHQEVRVVLEVVHLLMLIFLSRPLLLLRSLSRM